MDSFTLNKAAGAVLMVLILTMGVGIVSDIIFETEEPETPGYAIAVATEEGGAGAETAEAATEEPIAVRLASASAADGEKVAKKCAACHDFSQGGANKVGPALWGVVGRKPASHEGFAYSAGMVAFGEQNPEWSFDHLDAFILKPKDHVPGTSMGFAGLKKPEERADLIAYLREQADSPVPLPEATATAQ
ncbi:c-type cytochrome [Roseibium aestuarii]|uniref:C-type cytochrome n=1 Tax=Roseibium aestuarii TaxID=2600299 RepID=A0ABW4K126_9HYPH|nr:cytochrome c family protein [Roseibium aestuarii]